MLRVISPFITTSGLLSWPSECHGITTSVWDNLVSRGAQHSHTYTLTHSHTHTHTHTHTHLNYMSLFFCLLFFRCQLRSRSEERRVGKERRSRGSPYH